MVGNTHEGKTLYYAYLNLEKNKLEGLHTDFQSLASGKNHHNLHIALHALKKDRPRLRLHSTYSSLIRDTAIPHNLLISLWADPKNLEKDIDGEFWHFKEDGKQVFHEHDLNTCVPVEPDIEIIATLCHSQTLYDLSKALVTIFHIEQPNNKFKELIPYNFPYLLAKELERLGLQLYGDEDDFLNRYHHGGMEINHIIPLQALPGFDHTLDSVRAEIKTVARALTHIKIELYDYLKQHPVRNIQQHLKFLETLEQIENAIVAAFINLPEYKHSETGEQYSSFEKQFLGFITPENTRSFPEADSSAIRTPGVVTKENIKEVTHYLFHGEIQEEQVDLEQFPQSHHIRLTDSDCLVLGDLHGNTLKLLYFLIHEHIMTGINEAEYNELVEIYKFSIAETILHYKKTDFSAYLKLMEHKLSRFHEIIGKLVPVNEDSLPSILLLGDILADRGDNDDYTFHVLEQLKKHKMLTKIILSNHDIELLEVYEKNKFDNLYTLSWLYALATHIHTEQTLSLNHLCEFMRAGLITRERVLFLIEHIYLPMLTGFAINVCAEKKEVILFTHAPVDLYIIPQLAKQLNIEVDEDSLFASPQQLISLTNTINDALKKLILEKQLTDQSKITENIEHVPLHRLIWKRIKHSKDETRAHNPLPDGWSIRYVHGHDGMGLSSREFPVTKVSTRDMDNTLGHRNIGNKGAYCVYYFGNNPEFLRQRQGVAPDVSAGTNQHAFFGADKETMSIKSDVNTLLLSL